MSDVSRDEIASRLQHVTCSHSVNDLCELIPGSTRSIWIHRWIPELMTAGVLVKRGRRFLGKPAAIVAAIATSTVGNSGSGGAGPQQ